MTDIYKRDELLKLYINETKRYINIKAAANLVNERGNKYLKDILENNSRNALNKMSLYLDLLIDTQERINKGKY